MGFRQEVRRAEVKQQIKHEEKFIASVLGVKPRKIFMSLYICRELVRRMEGRIWVDSDGLGSGSTFHIELPVAEDFAAHLASL